jgi:hypothetical protein
MRTPWLTDRYRTIDQGAVESGVCASTRRKLCLFC